MLDFLDYNYVRFQNRNNPSFPNKCDICGLRHNYNSREQETDQNIITSATLQNWGLAVQPARRITASFGSMENPTAPDTYFCVLGHRKYWSDKYRKCPDWQLRIPSSKLSLADYLNIHHTKVSYKTNKRLGYMTIAVGLLGVVVAAVGIVPIILKHLQ